MEQKIIFNNNIWKRRAKIKLTYEIVLVTPLSYLLNQEIIPVNQISIDLASINNILFCLIQ